MGNRNTDGTHGSGDHIGKFCSLRKDNCGHNEYKAPCAVTAAAWDAEAAGSSTYLQKKVDEVQDVSQNAHHLLCVSCVTAGVTRKDGIELIVRATEWCANNSDNMIALPLWPHTIEWYVSFNLADETFSIEAPVAAPPFKNLAQHDYDHSPYIKEVSKAIKNVVNELTVSTDEECNAETANEFAGDLDTLSDEVRAKLVGRPTHEKWNAGRLDEDDTWYKAFSMASAKQTKRPFPNGGKGRLGKKIRETLRLLKLKFG